MDSKLKMKNPNVTKNQPPQPAPSIEDSDDSESSSSYDPSDEESLKDYCEGGYHPVRIGDMYNRRYIVIRKIGFGHFSTVWMCWDFKEHRFVALKIMRSDIRYACTGTEEIRIHAKVRKTCVRDLRHQLVVPMWECFYFYGVNGKHTCMVFEMFGDNLNSLLQLNKEGLALNTVRHIMRQVLLAIDFLHNKCKVIHTDLKPENLLTVLKAAQLRAIANDAAEKYIRNADLDKKMVSSLCFEQLTEGKLRPVTRSAKANMQRYMDEWNRMAPRPSHKASSHHLGRFQKKAEKTLKLKREKKPKDGPEKRGSRAAGENMEVDEPRSEAEQSAREAAPPGEGPTVKRMEGRGSGDGRLPSLDGPFKLLPQQVRMGRDCRMAVKIGDLGNAVNARYHKAEIVQTREYRAVEVILGCGFDAAVDIWSLACVAFELATGDLLFDPDADNGIAKDEKHLGQIVQYLGPIPKRLLLRSLYMDRFYDATGKPRFRQLPSCSLACLLYNKYDFKAQDAEKFASFLLQMLRLEPQERATAAECLKHPWITGD